MPISISNAVVVFDYGEVISVAPTDEDRTALLRVAGIDDNGADAFWEAYWAHRDGLDEGTLAITDYWRGVANELDVQWSDALIHHIWATDFRGWLSVEPATLEILVDLQEGGTRMALLSNAGRDFGSFFRHGSLGPLFEQFFVSGELGMIKPNAEIFLRVVTELGITAQQMVFIDNREVNVRGAEAIGARGHVFVGASDLRDYLMNIADEDSSSAP
jgi:putative hydrolase of the HAD superfamily